MPRFLTTSVASLLVFVVSVGANATAATGVISGLVTTTAGYPLASCAVRARDLATGQVASSTTCSGAGQFSFPLPPGTYAVETINARGEADAVSFPVTVISGTTVALKMTAANALGIFGLPALASHPWMLIGVASSVAAAATVAGIAGAFSDNEPASPSQ